MSENKEKYEIVNTSAYYVFIILVTALPLIFWKGVENSFNLIKSFVFSITGCLFIVLSVFAIGKSRKKNHYQFAVNYKFDLPVFLFLVSVVISSLFSVNLYSSINGSYDRQMGMVFYNSIILIYLLSPLILESSERINKLLFFIETTGVLVALFPLAQAFGLNPFGIRPANFTRPFSPAGHPVFTAGLLSMIVPVSLLNIAGKKNVFLKYGYPAVIIAGILLTLTRTSIAALIIQVFIVILIIQFFNKTGKIDFKKIAKLAAYVSISLIIILTLAVEFFPDSLPVKRIRNISHLTTQPRWYLWNDSFEMFKHNFLLGTGPGNFSYVFEDYAGYQLKLSEVGKIYDNAHNNILNTLCSFGILGGLSYATLIIFLLVVSFRMIINKKVSRANKIFYLFLFCSFTGYFIYGLADFDDITITLYFFVLLSVFKTKWFMVNREDFKLLNFDFNSTGRILVISALLVYSFYVSYSASVKLIAEKKYSDGLRMYNAGNFNEFTSLINNAVELEPEQTEYRYKHAAYLFDYCTRHSLLSADIKNRLLEVAKSEILFSKEKYISKLKCMEMLSLIELEEGNIESGLRLRDEIFKADTCRFSYRTNLAMYYLKNNEDSTALNELQIVLKYDPKGIDANVAFLTYLEKNEKYEDALRVCRTILETNPDNEYAKSSIVRLNQLIKKGK